jgi:sulfite reductase alpha subunit-like flavoprotein
LFFIDNPFGESTGAAVIFGVTGGVMEAALRTAADVLSGKDLQNVKYDSVRGLYGIKESTLKLGAEDEVSLNVAVCHQMRNVREFLARIEKGEQTYHFIEIMTCPGGCIGGGGLPQSRDADILSKRIDSVYSMDERMVKRKSHENSGVKLLYRDLLHKPLSHKAHKLLHTHYSARPRLPPITLKSPAPQSLELGEDSSNTIYVIFGTQSGTAAQAAKEIKAELQQFIGRSRMCPEPTVSLVAADALPGNSLLKAATSSLASIFVTCTFGEGEFPEQMKKFWEFLKECNDDTLGEDSFRYAVFGLGSSMYAAADQFNRAARQLDQKLSDMGATRMLEVGLGDDQSPELYRGELDRWVEGLLPKLFEGQGSTTGASLLDPPEPMFRLSLAPGKHRSNFQPLPPNYHFISLESIESVVSSGYNRPAAIFTFDLENTGLSYDVGDHLALLPRNPEAVVDRILDLYAPEITEDCVLTVETVDRLGDCPYPTALTARELLTQYLDLCGRPSRGFFKQLFLFASTRKARDALRRLFERDNPNSAQDDFDKYTDTHT